jgi:hypothetical protein
VYDPAQQWGTRATGRHVPNWIDDLLDMADALDCNIVEVAGDYNVATCRILSSQVHVKLPRELRNMVYDFVIPSWNTNDYLAFLDID